MKITQGQFHAVQASQAPSSSETTEAAAAAPLRTTPAAAIDPVLGEAQTQLHTMPEVDLVRVAEIKQAISEGKLGINLDELTLSMQTFFQR
ncbi:flagellar biosynthesis anti-sigma factor FlgM [Enterobacteriaceae bacterium RIT714]|nr:flagellar biosynthesis anti-sigma factor FlgM [Enterobacteriaceae bacterium RIT714]